MRAPRRQRPVKLWWRMSLTCVCAHFVAWSMRGTKQSFAHVAAHLLLHPCCTVRARGVKWDFGKGLCQRAWSGHFGLPGNMCVCVCECCCPRRRGPKVLSIWTKVTMPKVVLVRWCCHVVENCCGSSIWNVCAKQTMLPCLHCHAS